MSSMRQKGKEKKQEQANSTSTKSSGEKSAIFTAAYSSSVSQQDIWFADSGANEHMINRRKWFEISANKQRRFQPISKGDMPIAVGNGQVIYAAGHGNTRIETIIKNKRFENILINALFVP